MLVANTSRAIAVSGALVIIVMLATASIGIGVYIVKLESKTPTFGNEPTTSSPFSNPTSNQGTFSSDYIITNNAAQYFRNGYYSQRVNISQLTDGQIITVGETQFRFQIPPEYVTEHGTTMIVDYICDSFFHAKLANGSEFLLDHCIPTSQAQRTTTIITTTTTAGQVAYVYQTVPISWSMWELSRNTVPRVGVHVAGIGTDTQLIELVVSK